MLSQIPQLTGQIPQFKKIFNFLKSENAYDLPNSSHLYYIYKYKMSANESLGSHQLNSFATFLEETLPVSSESSRIQIPQQKPQLKKMEEDRKQKGGKKLEQNTAFEIPEKIYDEYCMPEEEIHGKDTMVKRKIRL